MFIYQKIGHILMSTNKTQRSVEIISKRNPKDLTKDMLAIKYTRAEGQVTAVISHAVDGVVEFGFIVDLFVNANFGHKRSNGDAHIIISSMEVVQASTWYSHVEGGESVIYHLGDEDTKLIIPALESAILAHVARSNEVTMLGVLPHPDEHKLRPALGYAPINNSIQVDFTSDGNYIMVIGNVIKGCAVAVIDKTVRCLVDFQGTCDFYKTHPQYRDGILIEPKIAEVRRIGFDDEDFVCEHFGCATSGQELPNYVLSEDKLNEIKHIVSNKARQVFEQNQYPLGVCHQLSA